MTPNKRYSAFISYRHIEPDMSWAKWLHNALETYHIPKKFQKNSDELKIGRVFRDEEELPVSPDLSGQITKALEQSEFLIVICSPRTPLSQWCQAEIEYFQKLGRHDRIIALLIEGEPSESFPKPLCEIRSTFISDDGVEIEKVEAVEPLAADVRKSRTESLRTLRRLAKLRILACLLGCSFDDLRQREKERTRKRFIIGGIATATIFSIFLTLGFNWWSIRQASLLNETLDIVDEIGFYYTQDDIPRLLSVLPKGEGLLSRPYPDEAKSLLRKMYEQTAPYMGVIVKDKPNTSSNRLDIYEESYGDIDNDLIVKVDNRDNLAYLFNTQDKNYELSILLELDKDWHDYQPHVRYSGKSLWTFRHKKDGDVIGDVAFKGLEFIREVIVQSDPVTALSAYYIEGYSYEDAEDKHYRLLVDFKHARVTLNEISAQEYIVQLKSSGTELGTLYVEGKDTGIPSENMQYLEKRADGHWVRIGEDTYYVNGARLVASDRYRHKVIGSRQTDKGREIYYDDCVRYNPLTETKDVLLYPTSGVKQCVAIDNKDRLFTLADDGSIEVYTVSEGLRFNGIVDFATFTDAEFDNNQILFKTDEQGFSSDLRLPDEYSFSLTNDRFENAGALLDIYIDKNQRRLWSLYSKALKITDLDSGLFEVMPLPHILKSGNLFKPVNADIIPVYNKETNTLVSYNVTQGEMIDSLFIDQDVSYVEQHTSGSIYLVTKDQYYQISVLEDGKLQAQGFSMPFNAYQDIAATATGLSLISAQNHWIEISNGEIVLDNNLGNIELAHISSHTDNAVIMRNKAILLLTRDPESNIKEEVLPVAKHYQDQNLLTGWKPTCVAMSDNANKVIVGLVSETDGPTGVLGETEFAVWDVKKSNMEFHAVNNYPGGFNVFDGIAPTPRLDCHHPETAYVSSGIPKWITTQKDNRIDKNMRINILPWSKDYRLEISSVFGHGGYSLWRFLPSADTNLLSWVPKQIDKPYISEREQSHFKGMMLEDVLTKFHRKK